MILDFFFPVGLCISAILIIAIFGRKQRSRNVKLSMLIIADVIFIVSAVFLLSNKSVELLMTFIWGILNIAAMRKIFSKEDPNQETKNSWHDDPTNWKMGLFYFNPKDKRTFPPKRIEGLGWTINFANPYSIAVMIGMILVIWVIMKLIKPESTAPQP